MILSKNNIVNITSPAVSKPAENLLQLPVKVMQFGTGVLLRGLVDYLIDKANREGIFNGRVVVIKSTSSGDTSSFNQQDSLYTLQVRGIENGNKVEENIICSSISHVLTATDQWEEVLAEAVNPELKVVVSNTTEVGIQLVEESITASPPSSFPAKLLAILYKRYSAFKGDLNSGLVVIPTELLPDNGQVLKNILVKLIEFNQLETEFTAWFHQANHFCSSLVDRIVPGKPNQDEQQEFAGIAGYTDDLLISTEVYRLWAIEGNDEVRSILSFEKADDGVVVTPDINLYRELKLRLLNGTHTLSCALAYLSGFDVVNATFDDANFQQFVKPLTHEIANAIPYAVTEAQTTDFINKVIDRFRNPYIEHKWISISQQYTTKLRMRVVPLIQEHYKKYNNVPKYLAFGFAAYLLFMKSEKQGDGFSGERNGVSYPVGDDKAAYFSDVWASVPAAGIAETVLQDELLWGTNLAALPGFAQAVQNSLNKLLAKDYSLAVE